MLYASRPHPSIQNLFLEELPNQTIVWEIVLKKISLSTLRKKRFCLRKKLPNQTIVWEGALKKISLQYTSKEKRQSLRKLPNQTIVWEINKNIISCQQKKLEAYPKNRKWILASCPPFGNLL